MIPRIWNLVRKEFIQLRRDWLMTAFILTLPVLQLVLLAQATGAGISDLEAAVVDFDRSTTSQRLIAALDNHEDLATTHFPDELAEAYRLLDQGEVALVVTIPRGFGSDITNRSRTARVQLIADASNNVPASSALSAARAAIGTLGTGFLPSIGGANQPAIDLRTVVWFNPAFNVKFFTIPAQAGFIIYQVTLVVASIGLARERELGTLEQLLVTPLRRFELVVGKAVPAMIIGIANFALMLGVTVFVFGVPFRGSLPLLLGLTWLFVLAEIGYGMFISGFARTQQQAILLVFVLAIVDVTFSGYLVRVRNLPVALQAIAQFVPFSHYLTIIRGVMLKGAGLSVLWPHAVAMALIGLVVGAVAVRNLSRKLD
jgi:ABC-2 type transport system permease protein